jgi:ribonuclease-3
VKGPSRPKRTRLRSAGKAKRRLSLSPDRRETLEARIGYRFNDDLLLVRALTHPSLIDEYDGGASFSNQRLEFLGDRVLGLVMAEWLIQKYPNEREGFLTKVFHRLVSGETCAKIGHSLQLREFLFVDPSMQRNESGHYDKAVGDAIEALIAAIYRDGGLKAADAFIRRIWVQITDPLDETSADNPKTRLSDWCGANKAPYATYETLSREGPDHAPIFTVQVSVEGHGIARATGRSKQDAEKAAAHSLLEQFT